MMSAIKNLGKEAMETNGTLSVWILQILVVGTIDPDIAELLLNTCLERDHTMELVKEIIDNGSLCAPVSIWRPRRKVLSSYFSIKNINSFVPIVSKHSEIFVEQVKNYVGKGNVSLFENVMRFTLDSLCEIVLGLEVNTQITPNHPFPKAVTELLEMGIRRAVKPWYYYDIIYRMFSPDYNKYKKYASFLKKFIAEIVKLKRNEMDLPGNSNQSGNPRIKTLIEYFDLVKDDKHKTDVVIKEEISVLIVTGTETASTGASFVYLMMAKYPDIQEKVYEELKAVLGDCDRSIQLEDLKNLKYLDAVIKETLRLYPPVPITKRRVTEIVTLPSGLTLEPGMEIAVLTWGLHRNPKYWGPDANVFKPERFLKCPLENPSAYMPFSKGRRMCIGYNYALILIKTLIATLVRRYRLILPSDVYKDLSKDEEDMPTKFELVLKDIHNFQIQLELRNTPNTNVK